MCSTRKIFWWLLSISMYFLIFSGVCTPEPPSQSQAARLLLTLSLSHLSLLLCFLAFPRKTKSRPHSRSTRTSFLKNTRKEEKGLRDRLKSVVLSEVLPRETREKRRKEKKGKKNEGKRKREDRKEEKQRDTHDRERERDETREGRNNLLLLSAAAFLRVMRCVCVLSAEEKSFSRFLPHPLHSSSSSL